MPDGNIHDILREVVRGSVHTYTPGKPTVTVDVDREVWERALDVFYPRSSGPTVAPVTGPVGEAAERAVLLKLTVVGSEGAIAEWMASSASGGGSFRVDVDEDGLPWLLVGGGDSYRLSPGRYAFAVTVVPSR